MILVDHPQRNIDGAKLNCIWWWGSSSVDLGSVEYLLITITPKSTLSWSGSTYWNPTGQIDV